MGSDWLVILTFTLHNSFLKKCNDHQNIITIWLGLTIKLYGYSSVLKHTQHTQFWGSLLQFSWSYVINGKKCIVSIPTAAPVFEVGRVVQSPMPKMLGYLMCCRVPLSMLRKPTESDNSLFLAITGVGQWWGQTCNIWYCMLNNRKTL